MEPVEQRRGVALFKSTCGKTSGFTADDLSEEGTWLWDVLHSEGESAASATGAAAGTANTTAGSAASANNSGSAAAGGALHSSTGTFDWTATVADRWEAGDQKFFRYVITVTNKGDSAVINQTNTHAATADIDNFRRETGVGPGFVFQEACV